MEAMQDVLEEGKALTPDLGGQATTEEVGDAICAKLKERMQHQTT
jgi:tartrate dehydrogenase/decarboxylase/D-malate dehydrogenase